MEEEGYFGVREEEVALSKCMVGILKAEIEVPEVPLCLNGPGGEVDNDHLVEQDAGVAYRTISEGENKREVQ